MALRLTYWRDEPDGHSEIKNVRLRSISQAAELSEFHNRPQDCSLITLDRTDSQSFTEQVVWMRGLSKPVDPTQQPSKVVSKPVSAYFELEQVLKEHIKLAQFFDTKVEEQLVKRLAHLMGRVRSELNL